MGEVEGRPVRVEVVDIMGAGSCASGIHEVGQHWTVTDSMVPAGMCGWAYNAISPFIAALRFDGRFPWRDEPVTNVCCPDADNPVVFRVSIDE